MDRGTRAFVKLWLAAMMALLAAPLAAQVTSEEVHRAERERFGFGELRQGASGNPEDANAANTVEANVGEYTLPPLFEWPTQENRLGWVTRRHELREMVEDVWVGRIPATMRLMLVEWEKVPLVTASVAQYSDIATIDHWQGRISTRDGRSGPVVDATIFFPKNRTNLPAIINYTYMWPGGVTPDFGGSEPPDPIRQALERGWVYVQYRPQRLQADNAAEMQDGVIGLARWPRLQHDWGALRAWAWGASELREQLAKDQRIAADRISLTGHSRFGKGVLVAAAFDDKFHDAHVSSSGAGGAKLMRRDFGERWENMAGSGAFHWFTPNIMNYARDPLTVHDLPVDAHSLIALRAPYPLFITSGLAEAGDSWVDPRGMWEAYAAAQPAWAIYGANTPRFGMPVPQSREQLAFPLGWYQHGEGHVPWPAYEAFYEHAERFPRDWYAPNRARRTGRVE